MAVTLALLLALAALAAGARGWPATLLGLGTGAGARPGGRRRRPASRGLSPEPLYESLAARLEGTALWRLAALLCERAGTRATPAETLLFSAGLGLGLAVAADAGGAPPGAVAAALLVGAAALPVHLLARGLRRAGGDAPALR